MDADFDTYDAEEEMMVRFENTIGFVETIASLTHGDKCITPASLMICLMDDRNFRNFAIDITGTENWIQFVRRCIMHYKLKNGKWVGYLKRWKCRVSH